MAELTVGINSYVTLEEADTYVSGLYPTKSAEYQSWFNGSLSDDDKKAMLAQSARSLNNIKYTGGKLKPGQVLAFPRAKRFGMGPGIIPTWFVSQSGDNSLISSGSAGNNGLVEAGEAQIENALAYASLNTTLIVKSRERRLSGLSTERAGSISKTYNIKGEDSKNLESGIYTSKIDNILRAWITESVYTM